MRNFMIILMLAVMALCAQPANAQEDNTEEIRLKMLRIELEMRKLELKNFKELRARSMESITQDLNDLDRRTFELELELAQINAHRGVLLSRVEQQKQLIEIEKKMLTHRIDIHAKQKAAVESQLDRTEMLGDDGKAHPLLLEELRRQIMEIEERAALLKLEPLRKEVELGEIMVEVESELMSLEAQRDLLEKREHQMQSLLERAAAMEEARIDLEGEFEELSFRLEAASREDR